MKLSELREHTREGRWESPGAMRWNLDLGSLQELAADIDRVLSDTKTKSYLQGAEFQEKQALSQNMGAQWRCMRCMSNTHSECMRPSMTATAESPLGVELSKIRDRLNKLETQVSPIHPSVLDRMDRLDSLIQKTPSLHAHAEMEALLAQAHERLDAHHNYALTLSKRLVALESYRDDMAATCRTVIDRLAKQS